MLKIVEIKSRLVGKKLSGLKIKSVCNRLCLATLSYANRKSNSKWTVTKPQRANKHNDGAQDETTNLFIAKDKKDSFHYNCTWYYIVQHGKKHAFLLLVMC